MRKAALLLAVLLTLTLPSIARGLKPKELKVVYEHQGVQVEYLLFTDRSGTLYCKELSGSWDQNPIWIWNYVEDFWAEGGPFGLLIIFKSFGEIRWVIIDHTTGKKIYGGFLAPESKGVLKNVEFKIKNKGAFVTLVFYDEYLQRLWKEKYWVDIWGRREKVESSDEMKGETY